MQLMDSITTNNLPFIKMHGLGNDFVIIDARKRDIQLTQKVISGIADRHFGVGFDQLAVISKDDHEGRAETESPSLAAVLLQRQLHDQEDFTQQERTRT